MRPLRPGAPAPRPDFRPEPSGRARRPGDKEAATRAPPAERGLGRGARPPAAPRSGLLRGPSPPPASGKPRCATEAPRTAAGARGRGAERRGKASAATAARRGQARSAASARSREVAPWRLSPRARKGNATPTGKPRPRTASPPSLGGRSGSAAEPQRRVRSLGLRSPTPPRRPLLPGSGPTRGTSLCFPTSEYKVVAGSGLSNSS